MPTNPTIDRIFQMGLTMLREESRINDACLSMAIDHEFTIRAIHETAIKTLRELQAVKRDIQARADDIMIPTNQAKP